MADNYIIDPSHQQGQPQHRKGSVGSPNKGAGSSEAIPSDTLKEGPVAIPDHPDGLMNPGVGPMPLPDHPGRKRKKDNALESMKRKIGKEDRL
jgi:hypothetical protein